MIDIISVKSMIRVPVTVELTGAPPMRASYSDRQFLPALVRLNYSAKLVDGVAVWTCDSCEVSGPRILKPAADGSVRLGKDDCKWTRYEGSSTPGWLRDLVNELRPAYLPELPGDLR